MARATKPTAARPGRRFVVRRSSIHNRGVFALATIAKGERIIEYKGERVSHKEADRRYDRNDGGDPSHTFLFSVDDDTVIDANFQGNDARWINHSCSPNCETTEDDHGRIFIEAIRTIRPGEELTYDYCLFLDERYTPRLKKVYECRCGSKNCRGTMLKPKR